MAKIIGVLNPKGGVGKTTLAVHIARALHMSGHKVLLVDSDPQGSAGAWQEAGEGASGFSVVGMDRPTLNTEIRGFANDYEWIIIDGAARLEKMIIATLKAADLILIPVQPSQYDIWACQPLVELIQDRQELTDGRPAAAFVITRAKKGTVLARTVANAISAFGLSVLKGQICDRTVFASTVPDGSTVLDAEPDGHAAHEVRYLVRQLQEAFSGR